MTNRKWSPGDIIEGEKQRVHNMLPLCEKEGKIRGECVCINMYAQSVCWRYGVRLALRWWSRWLPCVVSSCACLSFPHLSSEWTKKQRYSTSTSDTQILFTIISCWKESELSEKCLLKGKIDVSLECLMSENNTFQKNVRVYIRRMRESAWSLLLVQSRTTWMPI